MHFTQIIYEEIICELEDDKYFKPPEHEYYRVMIEANKKPSCIINSPR